MSGPRYNQFINVPKVRVIDENGENLGVMYTKEAIEQAAGVGLDLVEISPGADPPVAKFLDIGRFKYEAQKKANEQRKRQKTQEIKEIKMRPNIDDHDYDVKMRKVFEFLEEGDKVKLTLRFRGREMAHNQLGMAVLQRVAADTEKAAKVEAAPAHGRPPDADGHLAQVTRTNRLERAASSLTECAALFVCAAACDIFASSRAFRLWRKAHLLPRRACL